MSLLFSYSCLCKVVITRTTTMCCMTTMDKTYIPWRMNRTLKYVIVRMRLTFISSTTRKSIDTLFSITPVSPYVLTYNTIGTRFPCWLKREPRNERMNISCINGCCILHRIHIYREVTQCVMYNSKQWCKITALRVRMSATFGKAALYAPCPANNLPNYVNSALVQPHHTITINVLSYARFELLSYVL